VGAILGNDCIADLVGDTVLDGLVTHANLLHSVVEVSHVPCACNADPRE
jgi:hypothetical protein